MSYVITWVGNTSLSFGERLVRFFSGSWGDVNSFISSGDGNAIPA
jgi:hypothetical protein